MQILCMFSSKAGFIVVFTGNDSFPIPSHQEQKVTCKILFFFSYHIPTFIASVAGVNPCLFSSARAVSSSGPSLKTVG